MYDVCDVHIYMDQDASNSSSYLLWTKWTS